jgi:predicted RNA methylase
MPLESRQSLTTDSDLQDVLDSAGNAARTGLQQFLTPERLAAALAIPLPKAREVAVDFTAGNGALLRNMGARQCLGVDLDAKAIGTAAETLHPDGLAQSWATATADFTKLFGLLADVDCKFDLIGLNPPFSMQWDKSRFNALATSECRAVREVFGAAVDTSHQSPVTSHKPKTIDSTLASLLAALDRLTPAGEGYILGNESTFTRLLGAPDGSDAIHAPCRQLREHVWLWLSLPDGTFPTANLRPAVLYFARGHSTPVNSPIFQLTVPDYGDGGKLGAAEARARAVSIAHAAAQTLSSIPQQRFTLRHGQSLHAAQSFHSGTVERWRACLAEYRTAVNGAKSAHEFNLWIEGGKIKRHLTPFQNFSGKIPKKDADALNQLHNQSPFALVMQKATRLALLRAVRGEADGKNPWRVDPQLATAVDSAMRGYHAARAPLYTPNKTQALGWLDEEDAITCTADLIPRQYISGVSESHQPVRLSGSNDQSPVTSHQSPEVGADSTPGVKTPWHQSTSLVPARLVQRNKRGEWVGGKDASKRISYGKTREFTWNFTETFDNEEQAVAWVCGGHREVKPAFRKGHTYEITTATRVIEREHRRPNAVTGRMEDCTLHGQELVIRIMDAEGNPHEFGDFTPAEAARTCSTTHPLEALTECFRIPEVDDVAKLHPEKFQAALRLCEWLDGSLCGGSPPLSDARLAEPPSPMLDGSEAAASPDAAAPFHAIIAAPPGCDPETATTLRTIQAAMRNNVDTTGHPAPIRFGGYQKQDMARGLVHGGALMGWEPGLGKTFPLILFGILGGARRHLLVVPESLHEQICREGRDKFGIEILRLNSQDDFAKDALLQECVADHLSGRRSAVRGWWITSYSQLGYNGADEFLGKEDDETGEMLQSVKILRERHAWPGWNPKEHDKGIGEKKNCYPPVPKDATAAELAGRTPMHSIHCLCRPTLATLIRPIFGEDAYVGCDEAVRLKANDSYTSLGVRRLAPQFRLVLTGTPVKNHLDDIFWLLWWAAGGSPEPTARFPYGGTNGEKEKFAREFMLIEQNHTREEEAAAKGAARSIRKRVPVLCNLHRLWKFFGPLIIRRRKDETAGIVPKTIVPITVTPGTAQQVVYQHHLVHKPQFTKEGKPMAPIAQILAQLTTLRVAALCPDSDLLKLRRVELAGVKDVLTAIAAGKAAAKMGFATPDATEGTGAPSDQSPVTSHQSLSERIRRATEGKAATTKAIKVARMAERSPFAAEADTALKLLQRMIEGDHAVDIDALCKAAPSLAEQIRAAIHVEKEPPASRSWTDHNPKQAAILAKIADLIAQGERVVVMSPFQDFGRSLFRRLQEAGVDTVLLDGDTSPAKRGRLALDFKRGRYAVLIGGSKSMGEGHSFECASHLIAPSIDWALDVNRQVEDRVHRLNSKKPVTIYAMVTANSIDVRLAALYREKADAAGLALDGRITPDTTGEVNLAALLRDAVRNFDPKAPTIDERAIETEWHGTLKTRLSLAMRQFREFIPIVDGTAPVTKADIKTALLMLSEPAAERPTPNAQRPTSKANALVIDLGAPVTSHQSPVTAAKPRGLLAAVPDGTLRVLLGLPPGTDITAQRTAFEQFAKGRTGDWRKLWKEWSGKAKPVTNHQSPVTPPDSRTPLQKIRNIEL